jgi:hypothetical protein
MYVFNNMLITECECHDQKQGPSVDKRARRKLLTACVLSLLFMTAEIIGELQFCFIDIYFNYLFSFLEKTIKYTL